MAHYYYVRRNNHPLVWRVIRLKDGVAPREFEKRFPDARPVNPPPAISEMESWLCDDGICESLDGCHVEPDGQCEHGFPSWLMYYGMV